MFVTKKAISRRTVLRGMGVTLALPLLDSMVPAFTAIAKTAAKPINRFGVVYVPNSMIMPLGTYMTPKRFVGFAAVFCSAESAGTMLSSSGSATIDPRPRSTVRRGIAFFVQIIVFLLEQAAERRSLRESLKYKVRSSPDPGSPSYPHFLLLTSYLPSPSRTACCGRWR